MTKMRKERNQKYNEILMDEYLKKNTNEPEEKV